MSQPVVVGGTLEMVLGVELMASAFMETLAAAADRSVCGCRLGTRQSHAHNTPTASYKYRREDLTLAEGTFRHHRTRSIKQERPRNAEYQTQNACHSTLHAENKAQDTCHQNTGAPEHRNIGTPERQNTTNKTPARRNTHIKRSNLKSEDT